MNNQGGMNPDELVEAVNKFFRSLVGQAWGVGAAILGIVLLFAFFTSYYTVQPDEEAVVLRLGKYLKTETPGLHFKLPFRIDEAIKLKTKQVHQAEFGFRTRAVRGSRTDYASGSYKAESLMLTGDLNILDVQWVVQYQISEPKKYLFHVSSPQTNISDISQAVMRRSVGDRLMIDVIKKRSQIGDEARRLTQEILDRYDMGIHILSVKLQDIHPPEEVRASFNEVDAAKQEQEQVINQAEKEYNRVIPEARGKAEEQIARAQGYATALVNRSLGDSEKFDMILKEYRKAPAITRKRLYLETMEKLIGKFKGMIIVDKKVKGILPIFSGRTNDVLTGRKSP